MQTSSQPSRIQILRQLYEKSLELQEEQRSEFLEESSKDDPELREELEQLLSTPTEEPPHLASLRTEMLWPALKSLSRNPSVLQRYLAEESCNAPTVPQTLVGKRISRFEVQSLLGIGGMGIVYKAVDTVLAREVALKFLPPNVSIDHSAKRRFIEEAKAASGLDHPNIATLYEIGEPDDQLFYIAMGYYPGQTLKELLDDGPLPLDRALSIARQLASALAAAHENSVVHCDIKPGNILITTDDTVKLLDFGLAQLSQDSGYNPSHQFAGTVSYMSPEQIQSAPIDKRTDIWSFGIVLFEMLTGHSPFTSESIKQTADAIVNNEPSLEPLPPSIRNLVNRCLQKAPESRYQDCDEIIADLDKIRKSDSQKRKLILAATIAATLLVSFISIHSLISTNATIVDFTRVTGQKLVEEEDYFVGASWADFDSDGFIDVAIGTHSLDQATRLYRNNGNGQFTQITDDPLATTIASGMGPITADQDNDGDLDIYLCTDKKQVNAFFRNDGKGHFTRIIEDWTEIPMSSHNGTWGDYDKDGFIDLYLTNSGGEIPEANIMLHNRGDGSMERVYNETTSQIAMSHGSLWSDFDNDGDLDLLVGRQSKTLFRNDENGIFTWLSPDEGGIPPFTEDVSVTFSGSDYDNDGDIDYLNTTWRPQNSAIIYRNEIGRFFIPMPNALPQKNAIRAIGSVWGDFDNDGFQDLFIANHIGQNLLYHNKGDGTFHLLLDTPVTERDAPTAGGRFVDYDNDGWLDLFVTNGVFSNTPHSCELFHNEGGTNNWITLVLQSATSPCQALGAKVRLTTKNSRGRVDQLRELHGDGNGMNQNANRVHFGLGEATTISRILIEWPSGTKQELQDLAINQFHTITEPPPQ